jgi:hypothetical protein
VSLNNDRITEALALLTDGLAPYVERRLKAVYRDNWLRSATGSFRDDRSRGTSETLDWDAHSLLTVMWDQWNSVFRSELGHYERSLVSELREFRNRWAHQQEFDFDDTYRVLDSVRRLLSAVAARNVDVVNRRKRDFLETHVAEEVNTQIQRTAFSRNKWWVIGIYSLCVGFLLWNLVTRLGEGPKPIATALASVLALTLVYLIYQQFRMEPPLLYGPRECHKCHKIVYRKTCPYCE